MFVVLQTTELLNIAMLTGKMQTHVMKVYSVSHTGRIIDVTSQTTCHSSDDNALKVSKHFTFVKTLSRTYLFL